MNRLAVLPALALAIVPFVSAASTAPAYASTADLSTVSITVSMDLPTPEGNSEGPIVYRVTNATVTSGPELTGANLVSNPTGWGGSVTVDVDNNTHRITVATEDSDIFQTARVTLTGPGLGAITLVSDNLWEPQEASLVQRMSAATPSTTTTAPSSMPLTYGTTGGTATIGWASTPPNVEFRLRGGGAAVFSFTVSGPTTTTTTATAVPATTAPPARAKAVQARPAFTG